VAPFLRPANKVGDTPPLPYYLYCLVGIGVMLVGIVYWAIWRILLPRVLHRELVPKKEVLEDGTVVTVVRVCPWGLTVCALTARYAVRLEEASVRENEYYTTALFSFLMSILGNIVTKHTHVHSLRCAYPHRRHPTPSWRFTGLCYVDPIKLVRVRQL
jgi:hypothetical protein